VATLKVRDQVIVPSESADAKVVRWREWRQDLNAIWTIITERDEKTPAVRNAAEQPAGPGRRHQRHKPASLITWIWHHLNLDQSRTSDVSLSQNSQPVTLF